MIIPPFGPDRFGNSESFLVPPPQLGGSLDRLQEAQAQQNLQPSLQMQQRNAAMLMQMMQILSTLMANQEGQDQAPLAATSAETNLSGFDQSSVLDGSRGDLPASELGERLARAAESNARIINTPGYALREVSKVLRDFGFGLGNHHSCFQLVADLRATSLLQEVQIQKARLTQLPPGAIIVWDKGPGLIHGHVSVSLGDGREASSTVRTQLQLNANFWVFLAK